MPARAGARGLVATETLHLLAAGAWLGGLTPLLVCLPILPPTSGRGRLRALHPGRPDRRVHHRRYRHGAARRVDRQRSGIWSALPMARSPRSRSSCSCCCWAGGAQPPCTDRSADRYRPRHRPAAPPAVGRLRDGDRRCGRVCRGASWPHWRRACMSSPSGRSRGGRAWWRSPIPISRQEVALALLAHRRRGCRGRRRFLLPAMAAAGAGARRHGGRGLPRRISNRCWSRRIPPAISFHRPGSPPSRSCAGRHCSPPIAPRAMGRPGKGTDRTPVSCQRGRRISPRRISGTIVMANCIGGCRTGSIRSGARRRRRIRGDARLSHTVQ